jgi:hypothetical protein
VSDSDIAGNGQSIKFIADDNRAKPPAVGVQLIDEAFTVHRSPFIGLPVMSVHHRPREVVGVVYMQRRGD